MCARFSTLKARPIVGSSSSESRERLRRLPDELVGEGVGLYLMLERWTRLLALEGTGELTPLLFEWFEWW